MAKGVHEEEHNGLVAERRFLTLSESLLREDLVECEAREPKAADSQEVATDRKSTRLNSSHSRRSRMPSSA